MRSYIFLLPLFLVACDAPPRSMPLHDLAAPVSKNEMPPENERIHISRIGTFEDHLAYGDARGVYLIIDKKTGIEYLGISGIGISETGDHKQGKKTVEDER